MTGYLSQTCGISNDNCPLCRNNATSARFSFDKNKSLLRLVPRHESPSSADQEEIRPYVAEATSEDMEAANLLPIHGESLLSGFVLRLQEALTRSTVGVMQTAAMGLPYVVVGMVISFTLLSGW